MSLAKILIIAFLLRWLILLIFLTSKSYDLEGVLPIGRLILEHNPKYVNLYFPFFPYLGALALILKPFIHPLLTLKLIYMLFDIAIIVPVYLLAKKNLQAAFLYAVNPISIIATIVHGQFDVIPLFFLLVGLYLFLNKKLLPAVFSLSFAIYTKTWPALFVVQLIRRAKNKLIFILLLAFPLLFTFIHALFFNVSVIDIFNNVRSYRGLFGVWGWTKILSYLMHYQVDLGLIRLIQRVFLVCFFLLSFVKLDKNLLKNIILLMLFFLAFSPTHGIQWLVWPVPLLLISRPNLWRVYIVIVSIYFAFGFAWDADFYFRTIERSWNSVVTRVGIFTWLFIVGMFIYNIKHVLFKALKNKEN